MNILAAFVISLTTFLSLAHMQPKTTPTPLPNNLKWGVYSNTDISDIEALVDKQVDYVATFVHWGNENAFPTRIADPLKSQNKTLVIFWEAMDYNKPVPNQPEYNYNQILSGRYDKYIASFAQSAKQHASPVIIVPFEEVNGDWYPWSGKTNNNTPELHIAAYKYLRKFFISAPNVKFGWNINAIQSTDSTQKRIEEYYPGDESVDYIGINGFNFNNPWQTWSEIFGPTLTYVKKYHKPIIIMSTASAQGPKKPNWIKQGLGVDIKKYPFVIGWIWFNENKEKDWRINSDPQSLEAFKSVLP